MQQKLYKIIEDPYEKLNIPSIIDKTFSSTLVLYDVEALLTNTPI